MCGEFFCFLGNMLIGVYTTYIQKINNFRLVVCSPAYCLKSWMNVQNFPFSESIFKIHVIRKVEAIDASVFVIFYLDTGVCGIISQRDLNMMIQYP